MQSILFRRFCTITKNPRAFFDIAIANKPVGRLTFEVFKNDVPKTSDNFLAFCKGYKMNESANISYKDTIFHRIIPDFMCQGGDIMNGNGTGSVSIYGRKFEDENFKIKHDKPGLLSMANSGPNTNGSQFFLTTVETPWLDGHHVVFGELKEGLDVLKTMENEGSGSGTTKNKVSIHDCGVLEE